MLMYRLEVIAEFSKHWKNYFNSPPLAQFCTQTNQSATKNVWEVQVAYCPKLIVDSTGNALEKDKLIQETQQKKSAAFSHTQAASPDSNGCTEMSKAFPTEEYKPLYLQLAQAHSAWTELRHCFHHKQQAHYTPQILMVLVLAGIFQNESCK